MISRGLRRGAVVQVGRAPDVAVVVADHVEAPVGELGAEVCVPADHLGAQAHDEQHGGTIRIAERLVAELDVPDLAEAFVHHCGTLSRQPLRDLDHLLEGRPVLPRDQRLRDAAERAVPDRVEARLLAVAALVARRPGRA